MFKMSEEKAPFSTREMEIMAKAWNCMVEEPKVRRISHTVISLFLAHTVQIDYSKLAEACGMKNVRSASNAWAQIKKKILSKSNITKDDAEGEEENRKDTPKTTGKRKRANTTTAAAAEDITTETPAKKPKGKGRPKKSEVKVEEAEEDDVNATVEEETKATGNGEKEDTPVKDEGGEEEAVAE